MGRRQRLGRGPAGPGQSILSPGIVGPGCVTSDTSSRKWYQIPREEGRKPLWPRHPTQLWALLRLVTASRCSNLPRGQRTTHFLGQLFIHPSASSWGQGQWRRAGGGKFEAGYRSVCFRGAKEQFRGSAWAGYGAPIKHFPASTDHLPNCPMAAAIADCCFSSHMVLLFEFSVFHNKVVFPALFALFYKPFVFK